VQADAMQQTIHQVGHPRQISYVFEESQTKEKRNQIGQHNGGAAGESFPQAAHHRMPEAALHPVHTGGGKELFQTGQHPPLQESTEAEDGPEETQQQSQQKGIAPDGVHQYIVDAGSEVGAGPTDGGRLFEEMHRAVVALGHDDRIGRAAMGTGKVFPELVGPALCLRGRFLPELVVVPFQHLDGGKAAREMSGIPVQVDLFLHGGDGGFDVRVPGQRLGRGWFPATLQTYVREQIADTETTGGHGFDYGQSQQRPQAPGINADAFTAGFVHHVETDHHGKAHLAQLEGELEAAAQQRGIKHIDDEVNLGGEQKPFGGFLGGVAGGQRIDAGEVDQLEKKTVQPDFAPSQLHCGAGEVPGGGAIARDGVEDRALATTVTLRAIPRPTATVVPPLSTRMGPPIGASRRTFTILPARIPNWASWRVTPRPSVSSTWTVPGASTWSREMTSPGGSPGPR
jgi:hypothetical protein